MIETLMEWDRALFLWLNNLGHPQLDSFMLFLSAKRVWIPLYLLLIFLLYRHFGSQFWKPLLLVLLAAGMTDLITSGFMKPFFERLRPCHDPALEGLMVNVGKCGGKYGFASGHAANTFALATFFFTVTRHRAFWLLVLWAVMVSYSRVHLGVHYPGDILVGALIGTGVGTGMALLARAWISRSKTLA